MRAWRWGRGGRGRIAAWREVLLVGLSSGHAGVVGASEGRFCGDRGWGRNMFGEGICSG